MPRILVLLAVLVASPTRAADPPAGQRVFVTGHSFHMPIADPLDRMARAAGLTDAKLVGKQGIGGSTVTQHWDKDPNPAKEALKTGRVDVLTVAVGRLMPDPAIERFADLLLVHNPNGRVTVQASWLPRDASLTDPNVGFTNAKRDTADPAVLRKAMSPVTDKVREQVTALNAKYAGPHKRPVVFLVPVGDSVVGLRERVVRGEVPGIAKQSELFRDDLGHGKPPVYVLNAYCHFAVIYGRTPVGLPVPDLLKQAGLGENAEKVNRILQDEAWRAVTSEPASGVKAAK